MDIPDTAKSYTVYSKNGCRICVRFREQRCFYLSSAKDKEAEKEEEEEEEESGASRRRTGDPRGSPVRWRRRQARK